MKTIISLLDVARQSLIIRLQNQTTKITVWWQPSDSHWYASIEFPVNNPLASGIRLQTDEYLIEKTDSFAGSIKCESLTLDTDQPTRTAWGITHNLIYLP